MMGERNGEERWSLKSLRPSTGLEKGIFRVIFGRFAGVAGDFAIPSIEKSVHPESDAAAESDWWPSGGKPVGRSKR